MSTFVFVHGHWHGGWCWSRLVAELEPLGHRCIALDLPCTTRDAGTAVNAEVVVNALKDVDDEVILVGHSAGGLTIPLVVQSRPVKQLLFIAALLPIPGKSLADQFAENLNIIDPRFSFLDNGDGFCSIDPALAPSFFYNDCSRADADWATSKLRVQTTVTITEETPLAVWPTIPCSYIYGDLDRVVQPAWAAQAARERLGIDPIEMTGVGHSPFLSQPRQLARQILGVIA
ncbi:MAG TPA: alpha/beta hydrolase [Candidatus Saccharimonadales bacterium]|nr:alpha/beta hydrolase [Candidatus Saccharimonadales bacterium]